MTDRSNVVDLAAHRAPTCYLVHVAHHADETVELRIEGAASDERTRAGIAGALRRLADRFHRLRGAAP